METSAHQYPHTNSSPRAVAMVLALVSAIVLSPLYVDHGRKGESRLESRWSSGGLVLPVVVAGLIVAIKTTTSSSNNSMRKGVDDFQSGENNGAAFVFRIGSSTWGLAGILIMLVFVISWQDSVQHFFWR